MTTANAEKSVSIEYSFKFLNGDEKSFKVELDEDTLQMLPVSREPLPEWTRLSYKRCPNCPLDPAVHSHCPVAANLVDLVQGFGEAVSYEMTEIHVSTQNREYHKHTPLQYGVSALMGLHMVTSGCPIMDKLRPMVHSHLPFASIQETLYRFMSMYLLAQYYVNEAGGEPDWKMEQLANVFEDVGIVNKSFCQRLVGITRTSDAINNALVNLDCFALLTTMPLSDQTAGIKTMFAAWQKKAE